MEIGSTGLLAPGKWRWLRALGWMIALGAAVLVSFNGIARLAMMALGGPDEPAHRLIAAVAGIVAMLLVYALAVRLGERRAARELSPRNLPSELLLGSAIGAGVMALIVGILWLAGWVEVEQRPVGALALALRDSLRSGAVEEVVLRLVILRLLWRAFGVWPALIGSALLFGLLHLGNPGSSLWAAACLIAGEGIGIGLYLITGRIWASTGMHAAWNFAQGWLFGAVVSGTTGIGGGPLVTRAVAGVPEWLSGGGFGPEASLVALLVSLAASIAFLRWAWTHGHFAADDAGRR